MTAQSVWFIRGMGRSLSLQDGHMIARSGSLHQSQSVPFPPPSRGSSFNRRNTTGSQPSPRTSTSGAAPQDQAQASPSGKPPLSPAQPKQAYPTTGLCGSIETSGEAESIAGEIQQRQHLLWPLMHASLPQYGLFANLLRPQGRQGALQLRLGQQTCCRIDSQATCLRINAAWHVLLILHLESLTSISILESPSESMTLVVLLSYIVLAIGHT